MRLTLVLALTFACASACVIDRKGACEDADACDQALDEPFGDFAVDDPVFGDLGTCWQTEDSAAPCVQACNAFRAEQQEIALGQNRQDIFAACGGLEAADEEEEEASE